MSRSRRARSRGGSACRPCATRATGSRTRCGRRSRTASSSPATAPGTASRSRARVSAPRSTSVSPAGASCAAYWRARRRASRRSPRTARSPTRTRRRSPPRSGSSGSSPRSRRACSQRCSPSWAASARAGARSPGTSSRPIRASPRLARRSPERSGAAASSSLTRGSSRTRPVVGVLVRRAVGARSCRVANPRAAPTTIGRPMDDAAIAYDERGLVPCVIQDWRSGEVLTLAYMNAEALAATRRTGELHLWSRSRGELWRKGATSGNTQAVKAIRYDCDGDALLALVEPAGPACHTGERTCFHRGELDPAPHEALPGLERILSARAAERPEGSYTVELLDDPAFIGAKVEEEADERLADEAADVLYHLAVLLHSRGLGLADAERVLVGRRG